MAAQRYEFYVLVARTISHSFAALTCERLFLPLEHKIHIFSPPCNILYLFIFSEGQTNVSRHFPKIFWRLTKIAEDVCRRSKDVSIIHQQILV